VVDLDSLEGANWMLDLDSDPCLDSSGAALTAAGSVAGSHALDVSGASPSQQPRSRLPALVFSSPTLAELYAPVNMDSPRDSDYVGSSDDNSDSSSHYGSSVLASSERQAIPPSPATSSPEEAVFPSEVPAVSSPGNATSAPLGPWKNLFASNRSPSSGSQLLHYSDLLDAEKCEILHDDLDNACDVWKSCLIGYVSGRFPGFGALKSMIVNVWGCEAELNVHDSGWLIYKFTNEVDRLAVLKGGPYLVFGRPLILKEMPEFFDFNLAEICKVPVWIKLPNLPLRCWSLQSLSKIASMVGKPLQSDMLTSSMARLSYARILIEIDLRKPLRDHIAVSLPNGVLIDQQVIYETLPKFCSHCHVMGHLEASCSKVSREAGHSTASAAAVVNRSTGRDKRSTAWDNRPTARGDRLSARARIPPQARKDGLMSERAAAPLVDGGVQNATPLAAGMIFEAPATAGSLARPNVPSRAEPSVPMNSEVAHTDYEWQLVPKKLASNRQAKSVLGSSAVLAPGSVSVASKGKVVLSAGNVSVDQGMMDLGGNVASTSLSKGSKSLNGKSAGAVLQVSAETDLGLVAASKGILGDGRKQTLVGLGQGVHKGKGLQSKSHLSRGHGRIIPTTTAP